MLGRGRLSAVSQARHPHHGALHALQRSSFRPTPPRGRAADCATKLPPASRSRVSPRLCRSLIGAGSVLLWPSRGGRADEEAHLASHDTGSSGTRSRNFHALFHVKHVHPTPRNVDLGGVCLLRPRAGGRVATQQFASARPTPWRAWSAPTCERCEVGEGYVSRSPLPGAGPRT